MDDPTHPVFPIKYLRRGNPWVFVWSSVFLGQDILCDEKQGDKRDSRQTLVRVEMKNRMNGIE
jgi:hypothetical protein